MWKQLIGPEIRRKICRYVICLVCLTLYIALLPTVGGSVLGSFVTQFINKVM